MCREAPRRAHEWARRVPPIDRDPLAVRRACDRRFPAPAPDARRSVRLRKYAIFLPPVRQEPPISPRTLIPRPLRVPISRGSNVPRSLLWPRAALRVPISRGTFLVRALIASIARGAFLPRAPAGPRPTIALLGARGTVLPRALGGARGARLVGRASIVASTSRGTCAARARHTSKRAVGVRRASIGPLIAQRRLFRRSLPARAPRGMRLPRDDVPRRARAARLRRPPRRWSALFGVAKRPLDLLGVLRADLLHHLAQGTARLFGRHASLLELDADDAHDKSVALGARGFTGTSDNRRRFTHEP